MKLTRARVTNFKSIDDSGWVTVEEVTCLVGKNESGKTAFLQALKRLNPVQGVSGDFDLKDYPRKGYVRYKRAHKVQPVVVVSAEFQLSESDMSAIADDFGSGVLKSPLVVVNKDYANERTWKLDIDPKSTVNGCSEPDLRQQIVDRYLERRLPRFVYFDDYSAMRGRISIQDLMRRRDGDGKLDDADRTFLSLLALPGVELEDLESQTNYDQLKAELESASIGISDEIFEFWNQNKQLRVDFDLSPANPNDPPPLNSGTILHVRIWNNRHRVSVQFDERSKGFVWFFSFLAYFSKFEEEADVNLVLLLDEPGLNLHAMAQGDFLRFIDERLAPNHQVIYSTHSPFMINLDHLSRVRTVEDVDDRGTTISDNVFNNDPETVYPLRVALGYQMAKTLFLAPHCLLVNSPSDLIYLQILGEIVASRNMSRLDPRWVVIPVGSAENLPTFASLLEENYVSVAVMMDVTPKNKAQVDRLNQRDLDRRRNPVKWVEVTRVRNADIEDLFEPTFYLKLVNESYAGELKADLTMRAITDSNPRIVQRISAYFENEGIAGGHFDPYRPASYLLETHGALHALIDDATIDKAASMFERINSMLPTNGMMAAVIDETTARILAGNP